MLCRGEGIAQYLPVQRYNDQLKLSDLESKGRTLDELFEILGFSNAEEQHCVEGEKCRV